MLKIERVEAMFAEAHVIYGEALNLLEKAEEYWDRDLLRLSAKRTWNAALQATNALVLSRTGEEPCPEDGDRSHDLLLHLYKEIPDWETFTGRYAVISHDIYREAVLGGKLDPVDLLIHDIRQTADYIGECERLAAVGG